MKTLLGIAAAAALLVSAGHLAAAEQVTGKVSTIDQQTGTLVLETGETFTLGEGAPMEDIKQGDEVTVSYEERQGDKVVTDIQPSVSQDQATGGTETGTQAGSQ